MKVRILFFTITIPRFLLRHPRLFQILAYVIAAPLILLTVVSTIYHIRAQFHPLQMVDTLAQRTLVLDRQGESLGHVYGHGENRLLVSLDEVSPQFISALLTREDARFYWHDGVDYLGVMRAILRNYKEKRLVQGASTLTMQLARNSFGMTEKTIDRKLLEVAIARRIEAKFTKQQILELYMNRVYFGSGLYGIERAAQGYFMKPAANLDLAEAAMLAGIIRGPSQFSPFRDEEAALAQQREVLALMRRKRKINEAELAEAENAPLSLRPEDQRRATPGYVIQEVYGMLEQLLDPAQIHQGGFKVYTTIDRTLQQAAEQALRVHLAKVEQRSGFRHPKLSDSLSQDRQRETAYLQGALVALENRTGGILALVGGRDYDDSPFNRAFHARRQVGSTFKPFVYATAFQRGLLPGSYVSDGPISLPGAGGRPWRPQNSDGKFGGLTPASDGLIQSRNTMSIRVGQHSGLNANLQLATEVGFAAELPESPVAYLGAFESDPLSLTSSYSVFATQGIRRIPYLIERIENSTGQILFRTPPQEERALSASAAWLTTQVLGEVMDRGTGKSARAAGYQAPCYGKTGTTNDYRDGWFAGFTDKVTCGVWVGLDRPKTIMPKGYGSVLALPIWTVFMKRAEDMPEYAATAITPQVPLREATLCRSCGLLASRGSKDPYRIQLPVDLIPTKSCQGHAGAITRKTKRDSDNPIRQLGRFLFGGRRSQ